MTPLGAGPYVSVSEGTGINEASVFGTPEEVPPAMAGDSCSVVNDIKPEAPIVADLVRDAERSDCADAR